MSLKRRNIIAFILILFAAVCWTFGQQMLDTHAEGDVTATTHPGIVETMYPTAAPTIHPSEDCTSSTIPTNTTPAESEPRENDTKANSRSERLLGFVLSFAAAAAACVAIFVFPQKNPISGPDGISLIFALLATIYYISQSIDYILFAPTVDTLTIIFESMTAFAFLTGIRELFGWIRARFSLSWCLVHGS